MTERVNPPYLVLGEILRPHGVRGEVRVRLLTDYPQRITELDTLYIGPDATRPTATAYRLEAARLQEGVGLLKFRDVNDRNAVEGWRGLLVMVQFEDAVPLEEDEYYTFQLIGLTVITQAGHVIGTIRDIMETGANDVYIVDSPEFGEVLIPETPDLLVDLDLDGGFITVKLPDGLLPS
jgi:16S rRNA processing protein RimM